MEVAAAELDRIRRLYEDGLSLQAYQAARVQGPFSQWSGVEARVLAGRMLINLGAPRAGLTLFLRVFRESPEDPRTRYYFTRALFERRGPVEAWRAFRRFGDLEKADPETRSDWFTLRAAVLAVLRDFDAAEDMVRRAEAVSPGDPWVQVERAFVLQTQDRYAEALDAARRSLELKTWYRPGVQACAHLLQLLGRDAEALELLTGASKVLESGPVMGDLAMLQVELGRLDEAWHSLERFEELSPCLEKQIARWLAARRADVAYYRGDHVRAAEHARLAEDPFHRNMARRLESPDPAGRRVQLPVGFIRQHFMTCAPATLSALSRYWSRPADHLEVAETICYDGTSAHSERRWAEEHGWTAREFTVTFESARGLIDRGVPFTLTTVEPANAHLQAVIGYDSLCRLLLVRDPYHRPVLEFLAEETLERYRGTGPRGMLLYPRDKQAPVDGLELPEAELYDHFYRMQTALDVHDRTRAQEALDGLLAAAPGHRLALQAQRALAIYDADSPAIYQWNQKLHELFPRDGSWQRCLLVSLRELARRPARIAFLETICGKDRPETTFILELARELLPDAREAPRVKALLQQTLRRDPTGAEGVATMAWFLWSQRRFSEALDLYRFSACLDDKNEERAREYFSASRPLKETHAALDFLWGRFRRFGSRSSLPVRSLFWALEQLDRAEEAFTALEEALRRRPQDGDLLLLAARAHGRYGKLQRAAKLLDEAKDRTRRTDRLRTEAELARYRGDLPRTLALWREVAEREPLDVEAHRSVARLLEETSGKDAALDHLRIAARRFPHHCGLQVLLIEWLREGDPVEAEEAVRRLIEVDPADAWARRERALALGRLHRLPEAFEEMRTARELEPESPSTHSVLADLHVLSGDIHRARECYRRALQLDADFGHAITGLLSVCDSPDDRRAAAGFIRGELARQTTFGDGILAFRHEASNVLEPEELLSTLREAHRERPDLWQAWSALIHQLCDMDLLGEARAVAAEAAGRFPLLPGARLDVARVSRAAQDLAGEGQALEEALEVNPGWSPALRRLAEVREKEGDLKKARTLLERAVALNPVDGVNHGCLADLLWHEGDKQAAMERLCRALRLDPGYEWAWGRLQEWGEEEGQPQAAAREGRELVKNRPSEARSWLLLGKLLERPDDAAESLECLEKAIALNPRCEEAHDWRAVRLAGTGRFEEAEAACRPAVYGEAPPVRLRARHAWVEAERGDLKKAIECMEAVAAEDPNWLWAWVKLAEWHLSAGSPGDSLRAAERAVRLSPRDSALLHVRAQAKLALKDRAGARTDLSRALEINPGAYRAGCELFDLQLEDGDLEGAARTLEVLVARHLDPWVKARQVQLLARQRQKGAALEVFMDLCRTPCEGSWPLEASLEALERTGFGVEAFGALQNAIEAPEVQLEASLEALERSGFGVEAFGAVQNAIEAPEVQPLVGALWARRTLRRHWVLAGLRSARKVKALIAGRGKLGEQAGVAYLEALAERRFDLRWWAFLLLARKALRENLELWGTVGYALSKRGKSRAARRWLADWKERSGVRPWMLLNMAVALRNLARDEEAAAVSEEALRLEDDHTTPSHRLWRTAGAAIAGHAEVARKELGKIDPSKLTVGYAFLHAVVSILAGAEEAIARRDLDGIRAAESALRQALAERRAAAERLSFRRIYLRARSRLARARGGLRGRLEALAWTIQAATLRELFLAALRGFRGRRAPRPRIKTPPSPGHVPRSSPRETVVKGRETP